jgi:hypothetical protein
MADKTFFFGEDIWDTGTLYAFETSRLIGSSDIRI